MQQKLFLSVLNNFEKLFKSSKDYDVIIQAGENTQKIIYAHQSNYFDTAFSSDWAKKENGWTDRKNEALKKNPYNFNHIFYANRDGNTATAFQEKCDNREATIVIC
ncbi:hypothetical protein C1645_731842 [Glomus cerebriforme]|uniref:BTB domain-containing protein n=1 Tax=Glomus cerebriforme TaxID=658196 RepID=A0A397TTF6_9GLOM|nr:hypothetical protein C1645_731842 [Glomus cerebriforme]